MSPESGAPSCALVGPVVSPQACPHSPTQQAGGTGRPSHSHLSRRHLAIPTLGLLACRLPYPHPPSVEAQGNRGPQQAFWGCAAPQAPTRLRVPVPRSVFFGSGDWAPLSVPLVR